MNRGEVYWANLSPRSGSEQKGRRPVIVLSHDAFNHTPRWRSVIVVPISTSMAQAKRGPTVIDIPKSIGGLPKDSVVLCHQITTLDRTKLTERIGALPSGVMHHIEEGVKAALDME
jgi:mRNA interferase MazF